MQRLKGNLSTGSIFLQQADVRELHERRSWQNPALLQREARRYCCSLLGTLLLFLELAKGQEISL